MRAAGRGFLDVCARADTRRIVIEAPAILGWERCREVENEHALGLLQSSLERAVAEGVLASDAPAVLAQLLGAIFNEAGMIVAGAKDPDAVRRSLSHELDRIMVGLRSTTRL